MLSFLLLFLAAFPAVASIPTSTADGSQANLSNLTDNGTVVTSAATTYDAFGQRGTVREKIAAQDNQYRHVYNALGQLRETHITLPRPPVRDKFPTPGAPIFSYV